MFPSVRYKELYRFEVNKIGRFIYYFWGNHEEIL